MTAAALCTAICIAAATSARALDLSPLKLKVDGKDVPLKVSAVSDGHEVYLPLLALRILGCTFVLNGHEDAAIVTFPSGKKTEIGLARLNGSQMIPLSAIRQGSKLQVAISAGLCDIDTTGKERPKQVAEHKDAPAQHTESPNSAGEKKTAAATQSAAKKAE